MPTDDEREAELDAVSDVCLGHSHTLYMKKAWLLIALRRPAEGLSMARHAQRAWALTRGGAHQPYGGSIYWDPWIAEAAVALADGSWSQAEECARKVLRDFDEEDAAYALLELSLQAQGRLSPERVWAVSKDPARDLAEFDLRSYAIQRARQYLGPSG